MTRKSDPHNKSKTVLPGSNKDQGANTQISTAAAVRRRWNVSIGDGAAHAVMLGCGETYLGAFAIFLLGTPYQIGMLATLPQFAGAAFQFAGVRLMERFRTRRLLIVALAVAQSAVWILILLLAVPLRRPADAVSLLILLAVLHYSLTGFINPIWNSLIGDLVPETFRGRFFARRNAVSGFFTLAALIGAGVILHSSVIHGRPAMGFVLIFGASAVARLLSARFLHQHDDIELRHVTQHRFTFGRFIGRLPSTNFGRFVLFVAAMNFAVWFAAPYFSVYMLTILKLSYAHFALLLAASVLSQIIMLRYVGALADRFGNRIIIKVCSIGVCIVPGLWVFSSSVPVLVVVQTMAGLCWSGYNLASANFIFDAVPPGRRPRCVAYQAAINGVAVFAGASLGGYVATHFQNPIPFHRWFSVPETIFTAMFLLSACLRFVAVAIFQPLFREVRKVEPIHSGQLIFSIAAIRSAATFVIRPVAGLSRSSAGENSPEE